MLTAYKLELKITKVGPKLIYLYCFPFTGGLGERILIEVESCP